LVGDIGGTNIRFELVQFLAGDKIHVLKEQENFSSQHSPSTEHCIKEYLNDVEKKYYPKIAVVGIAGAVINNTVNPVNIPGWKGDQVGEEIRKNCNFEKFIFINDFVAMGYGITTLKSHEYTGLNRAAKNYKEP
jgi:glucokinase